VKLKLIYDRRSVGQFDLVSGPFWDRWPDFNFFEWQFLSSSCKALSLGYVRVRIISSAITHWFESHRTHNHTLLFHLRLPQPGGPGPRIYIPQEQGGPVKSQTHVTTDGQSVGQYVLVSSPRGCRRAVFERILILHLEEYIRTKFVRLPLVGGGGCMWTMRSVKS
jgi:hypothetical protein